MKFIPSRYANISEKFWATIQDSLAVKKEILSFQEDFNEGTFKNADKYTTNDWVHT